ncbi:hypothetical protein [Leptolyngbya sp. FACHB-17]|nr:hypothetical protein [Leptolyngbya sp. FACHB-17]
MTQLIGSMGARIGCRTVGVMKDPDTIISYGSGSAHLAITTSY